MKNYHYDEGQLRAFLDHELSTVAQDALTAHLATCPACTAALATLQTNTAAVTTAIAQVFPTQGAAETPRTDPQAQMALARFQATVRQESATTSHPVTQPAPSVKEQMIAMFKPFTTRRLRPALAAASVVAVLALLLAFTPLASLANQLVKTFRVQQFAAVTVHVPGIKEMPQPQKMDLSTQEQDQIKQMLGGLGTHTTNVTQGTAIEVPDSAAAKAFLAQYGATLQTPGKLPASATGLPIRYGTIQPTSSTYTMNVAVAKQYLTMANSPELNALPWPAGVDTLTFGLDTPAAVVTIYGDEQQKGFGVLQMANLPNAGPGAGPALKLPDELDVNAFRAALLALPGLPQDTVAQLKNVSDWERTLIIPVPENATSKNVSIKGNAGLLILDGQGQGGFLVWQDNGILYAVGGTLSEADLLLVANNLTNAR